MLKKSRSLLKELFSNRKHLHCIFSSVSFLAAGVSDSDAFIYFLFPYCFIYLLTFGCAESLATCRLSLAAESRGYSLVAVHGLLTAVSSLVKEDRL